MKSICVFCGSRKGIEPQYEAQAKEWASMMAEHSLRLVYGAGNIGIMGVIADTILAKGGEVTGVIPQFLVDKEVAHQELQELIIVDSMHERKQIMAERSDAFVVLPGGIGTFEEFFEILTWRQLNLHHKPIGILNSGEYYRPLIQFLEHSIQQGFLDAQTLEHIVIASEPKDLFEALSGKDSGDPSFDSEKI